MTDKFLFLNVVFQNAVSDDSTVGEEEATAEFFD
tara:strand:+ start:221 stop:322 length:102 start_codon:yes stop_codon:yes gene_type:complete